MIKNGEHINKLAVRGAKAVKGRHGRMCNDCACKKGSAANIDENALNALEQMLMSGGQFNCHTPDFQDTKRPCAGFLYIKSLFEEIDRIDEQDLKEDNAERSAAW